MVVVVDANVILSAIINIKGSIATLLITNSSIVDFIIPEFSLAEIKAKEKKIYLTNNVSPVIFNANLRLLLSCLIVISDDQITDNYFKAAYSYTKSIDPEDTIYVALAMALNALLWTGDLKLLRSLRRKGFKQIITTKELKEIIKGL